MKQPQSQIAGPFFSKNMKLPQNIMTIFRPFKLDDVITALHKIAGLPGLTISDIRGFGKSKAIGAADALQEGLHRYVKMVKLELVVPNDIADQVVDTIQQVAHTGNPGDGKMFVLDVTETIRIRTNERGEQAI